jgi:hypothetical protein
MSEIEAVVVEHDNKSYIRILSGNIYSGPEKNIAANGATNLMTAPGDNQFLVYDGVVETLERIIPAQRIVTKYELRQDLRGSPKEDTISVDTYRNLPSPDQALYTAVYEDIPRESRNISFVVQNEDGPPSRLPQGIVCTDRNYFARFASFHHLGPVRATARYVLYRLALRFKEIIADNPYITSGTHGVSGDAAKEILNNKYRDSFFVSAAPMSINGIEVTPKNLYSKFVINSKGQEPSYAKQIGYIDGDNLDDLQAKVTAYIDRLTEQHCNWIEPDKCPCCQRRFVKKPNVHPKRRRT